MKKQVLFLICLLIGWSGLFAQVTFPVNGPVDPRHTTFAFTNARIFVDYKTVVDSATLVIRDGLILDVGKEVHVPAEAVVCNLSGQTIYPSFIEIHADYGLAEVKRANNLEDGAPQFISNIKGA